MSGLGDMHEISLGSMADRGIINKNTSTPRWQVEYNKHRNSDWGPTYLSNKEEARFKQDIMKSPWFTEQVAGFKKEFPNSNVTPEGVFQRLINENSDYDYRGAWKAGVKPQPYLDGTYHWGSRNPHTQEMLKNPKHETAWMEFFMNEFGKDPVELGLNYEQAKTYREPKPMLQEVYNTGLGNQYNRLERIP